MDKSVVMKEIKNPEVRLWSEKTQKEKGDSLQGSYVSELINYAYISLKQNNVQELRDIWDSWKNDRKQKFNQRYGDIALLLQEDMVPTIEEYTTLLHYENIKLERVYIKHIKSHPFKNTLARVAGVDEKWVIDRTQRRGSGEGIEWIHIRQLMKNHPDEWKTIDLFALGLYGLIIFPKALGCIDAAVVELFEQLPRRVNPSPTILVETFRSLNHCRRFGERSTTYSPLGEFIIMKWHEGASKEKWMKVFTHLQDRDITWRAPWLFLGDVLFWCGDSDTITLLGLWGAVGYAPFLALRQYGARQFVPATYGIIKSEFVYGGDSYKKMVKEASESWKQVFWMDVVASRDMLTPDYAEWRSLRKNDNIPVPECEDTRTMEEHLRYVPSGLEITRAEFEAVNNELRQRIKELEAEHSQHQNQRLRIRVADLEKQHEKDGKTIAELEAVVDGFKRQANELQIVPFDGGLQWRFHWEQAQRRVRARDATIRDFLEQVQKTARHLHGLEREVGVVRQGIQPVIDESRDLSTY
ncbi:hypothetical protein F3Y22_tig00112441pilonHSYRG00004 [Hibiscus syriacus]|uniref:DUF7745 domain-containing protein n=1 Tax=Hibiscus syriacus TaxID=106335 RepID=A0A6A2WZK4_HIBSY|nr:hypothetical protein F3Y22_tig00112441pilonHSYRG00004 [Hibiscus syriacus]